MLIDDQDPMVAIFRGLAEQRNERALHESYVTRGLWHNLAYEVDGRQLTVTVAIPGGRRGPPPAITITLCPKKLLRWRIDHGVVIVAGTTPKETAHV